jgi:hypothetical protein
VAVAVGDFNGDGIQDLAVVNQGAPTIGWSGTVSICLGNGDSTFGAAGNYDAGLTPVDVAVGDFNGDGIPDLAVANSGNTLGQGMGVSILLGNGNGTFQAANFVAAGYSPVAVAVGDFNGDGILDLAVVNFGSVDTFSSTVGILLGHGDGSFHAAPDYAIGAFGYSLAIGDVNRDGILDLVVAASDSVAILLGNGDGTFRATVSYTTGELAYCVVVGDFNGDGILDLAVTNWLSDDVSVLLGNGDGTFQAAVHYAVGPQPLSRLAVRDFNGDGILDLAVVFGGGVRLLMGNGDGTFQSSAISYVAGTYAQGVAVADFNGDGFPDLAVANFDSNSVFILFNDGKRAP